MFICEHMAIWKDANQMIYIVDYFPWGATPHAYLRLRYPGDSGEVIIYDGPFTPTDWDRCLTDPLVFFMEHLL